VTHQVQLSSIQGLIWPTSTRRPQCDPLGTTEGYQGLIWPTSARRPPWDQSGTTQGYSGDDMANLCKEAAMRPIRYRTTQGYSEADVANLCK